MKRKLSSLLVASALSVMAMEAQAFSYTITNADGPTVNMSMYPGVTDLTVTASPPAGYNITEVDNLMTLGLSNGIDGTRIVGAGLTPTSTIDNVFDVGQSWSVALSNLNITNLNVSSGSSLTFGQAFGFEDGGHLTSATVTNGELYLDNLTSWTLGTTSADYQTTAGTVSAISNGASTAFIGVGATYIDTLNLTGVGAPNREFASSRFGGGALVRNVNVNYGQLERVEGQNQIDNLTMTDAQAAFYDNSHVNQLVFTDEKSVLEVGSFNSVSDIGSGSAPETVLTTFGGTTGSTAVEWSIVGGNQFAKLVVVEDDMWNGSGPVLPTTVNSNGDTVYTAALINATDSTQTAVKLTGDNIAFDVTTLDDSYINVQDWWQGYPGYRYDSTYFGGGINSLGAARKQNLLNVTSADATLLNLTGNNANLTLNVGGEGWDTGGIRINGNTNTFSIDNTLYNGFINAAGDNNTIHLQDFTHLSSVTTSGAVLNHVYLDATHGVNRDIAFGNVNTALTTNVIDSISGNMDLYLTSYGNTTRVNLQDAQAYGDTLLDVAQLSLSNSTLTLNRTNPLTVGTLVDRDVFTINGTLRSDGVGFIGDTSLVDMGAGRNTDLRIMGNLLSDDSASGDDLRFANYTLSLDENTGDHIYVGGDVAGIVMLDVGTITDLGNGNDSIELIAAPNDVTTNEFVGLTGTNVSYNNITGFYTLGASPYAWAVSKVPAGFYLGNVVSGGGGGGTPVFTPAVNTSVAAPIAATHFLGANISQSIANYLQAMPLGISHDKNMWGQYVYQKQKQDVIGGLSYTAKMTGWDIGVDVGQEQDSRWGLAASYRGLTNDLKVDVAGLSDASTGMDAVLLSAYGTRVRDAHVWDGQVYVGQAWAHHNMFGEGKQEKDKGVLWGGYGQYGYRHTMDNGLTVTPTIGVNYHETQWSDSSLSDGHNRYTRMYLELPLSGQTDNGLTWSIAPRYSYNFNAGDTVHINGVAEPVKVADMREEYGVSATLTQKTENNGTWYVKLSNDQLKKGDRTNITIGGSWSF